MGEWTLLSCGANAVWPGLNDDVDSLVESGKGWEYAYRGEWVLLVVASAPVDRSFPAGGRGSLVGVRGDAPAPDWIGAGRLA